MYRILKWWPCLSRIQLAKTPAKLTAAEFAGVQLEEIVTCIQPEPDRGQGRRAAAAEPGEGRREVCTALHHHNANMEGNTQAAASSGARHGELLAPSSRSRRGAPADL